MHARRDDESVQRELEVVAAGGAVADRDRDVFLQRRARTKPKVVVRTEVVRRAEMAETLGQLAGGGKQFAVVALAVGPEPIRVVVVLEFAQELKCCRRPYGCSVGGPSPQPRLAPATSRSGS
jgi:hypothetical protein